MFALNFIYSLVNATVLFLVNIYNYTDESAGLMENLKTNGDGDTEGSFEIINTIDQPSDNQIPGK